MSKKVIYGIFDDEEKLLASAKAIVAKGIKVQNVYSPFPIHGLDPVIGIPRSRLSTAAFIFGATGTTLALLMMWYMLIQDWPMDIGGKPNFSLIENLPSFIPVTFELTVLCAAHGMALTYLFRNRLFPGQRAYNPDPRTTDDKFLMEISVNNQKLTAEEIENLLKETGCIEIKTK